MWLFGLPQRSPTAYCCQLSNSAISISVDICNLHLAVDLVSRHCLIIGRPKKCDYTLDTVAEVCGGFVWAISVSFIYFCGMAVIQKIRITWTIPSSARWQIWANACTWSCRIWNSSCKSHTSHYTSSVEYGINCGNPSGLDESFRPSCSALGNYKFGFGQPLHHLECLCSHLKP